MTHPTGGTCGIMHRAADLLLTIPQGTALTVLVPMSSSVPQPAARRLPQPTHRADILCNVYISTLSRKCQDAELDRRKKSVGSAEGRMLDWFEGGGCEVGQGGRHWRSQWHASVRQGSRHGEVAPGGKRKGSTRVLGASVTIGSHC